MSRRLSKKSRDKALASTVALSAANLPKPESQRLDRLFARANKRRTNLRAALLLGSVFSAGILVASVVGSSPALAQCTQTGSTVNCDAGGNPYTGIGPYYNEGVTGTNFGVETINTTGVNIIGPGTIGVGNQSGNGIALLGYATGAPVLENSPFAINTDAGTSITGVTRDGIHMYSDYTGTKMYITNAGTIGNATAGVGHDAIYAKIVDPDETANNTISITNSNTIYGNHTGISALNIADVDPTDTKASDSNFITNSGQIGNPTNLGTGDGIFSLVVKHGGAGVANSDPTGTNTVINSAPIFHFGSAIHVVTAVTDGGGGTAKSYSNVINKYGTPATGGGLLVSADHDGIRAVATAQAKYGTAISKVLVSNGGAIYSHRDGIYAAAKANAVGFYGSGTGTTIGGVATASVTISNAGNITSGGNISVTYGNKTANFTGAGEGIHGYAYANASSQGEFGVIFNEAKNGVGGTATATTAIYNSGVLKPQYAGINGYSRAFAIGDGFGNGTGGTATASVSISNIGSITVQNTSGGHGIEGYSYASAMARAGSGNKSYSATGGTATATTDITNAATISSGNTSIAGGAFAIAGAFGNFFNAGGTYTHVGVGGTATAGVTISNTGALTASKNGDGEGINGNSYANANAGGDCGFFTGPCDAGNNTISSGGTALATTLIYNSGTIKSHYAGINGRADAIANAYSNKYGHGGTATASVMISNIGSIAVGSTLGGHGIEGYSYAGASGDAGTGNKTYIGTGGTATATTAITNTALSISSVHTSVYGGAVAKANAKGYTATGGTATGNVTITNSAALTSTKGHGIKGKSSAEANAGTWDASYTSIAGTAMATTYITNSGTIVKAEEGGIEGEARARANALASFGTKGATATGGTSIAAVTISNTGSITNVHSSAIKGNSSAHSNAFGFDAQGGTASATTTIYNGGTASLYSLHYTAIHGEASAEADGKAGTHGNATDTPGSTGTGGTANAAVTITNVTTGVVEGGSGHGEYASGIIGSSSARAVGVAYIGHGGTAAATTTISNTGSVYSFYANGVFGSSQADASGIGSMGGSGKGTGTGGTATATTTVTNLGAIEANTGDGYSGVGGFSEAKAVGVGFTATGGTATATTYITNGANITGDFGIIVLGADAGIFGGAVAHAGAYGSNAFDAAGKATGGTAIATTTIINHGNLYSIAGDGIHGFSKAKADGVARQATGGTATAGTYITNTGNIYSAGWGISGTAIAVADGKGQYGPGGKGIGGTATATVFITNSGNIESYFDGGINAFAGAFANGNGTSNAGGIANATATVSNTGNIWVVGFDGDGNPGIRIGSVATANGGDDDASRGTGGVANATTTLTNMGAIKTYADGAAGIYAFSRAAANGSDDEGSGGKATATTLVVNLDPGIQTFYAHSPGISAKSSAEAFGHAGGTATAGTTVLNFAAIVTDGLAPSSSSTDSESSTWSHSGDSPGILAKSFAGSGGTATAMTTVVNAETGTIATFGRKSDDIEASSFAIADAAPNVTASAITVVTNAATLFSASDDSDGINAFAGAKAYGFSILGVYASAQVSNSGAIVTQGDHSDGIRAKSIVFGDAYALTKVSNSGNITTEGKHSPGLYASSYAGGGVFNSGATATTDVSNSATILTLGRESAGILLYAGAAPSGGAASATIGLSNSGNVITYGNHSDGISAQVYAAGTAAISGRINISNSGAVVTYGHHSTAIYAGECAEITHGHCALPLGTLGAINISNSGSVVALGGWHQFGYHAIVTYGAPTTIINSGYIRGNVQLSNFNDVLTNTATGEWVMAGDSNFNGGTNVVNNAGLVKMDALASASRYSPDPATLREPIHVISLYGLEVFNNDGGTVSMVNGLANDRIVITGPSSAGGKVYFNGSGNSTLAIDAVLGGPPVKVTTPYHYSATYNSGSTTTTTGNFTVFGGAVTFSKGSELGNFSVTFGGVTGNFSGTTTTSPTYSATISGTKTRTVVTYTSSADVLQIGTKGSKGYVTGYTAIVVHDAAPNLPGAFNPVGIPVVESNGAPDVTITSHTVGNVTIGGPANVAGNFGLAGGPIQKGFFEYNLFYLPKGDATPCQSGFNCWFLASTPGTAAQEFTQLGQAADDIWSDAAGLWLDRTADLRDYFFNAQSTCDARGGGADLAVKAPPCVPTPSGVGPGAWVRAYGDWIHSTDNATWNAFGTTVTTPVHYNQDIGGAQMGYDWAFMRTGYSTVLVGLLGGANESTVNFASGTKVNFQGGNAGAYATFLNRGFFADGLFLANWMSMDYTSAGSLFGLGGPGVANVAANADMSQYGGRIDSGYRFQFNPWFFEPQLTAEVVHTSFGNLAFPVVATNVQLDDDFSVRGRLGGRIGTTWVTNGWRIEPSIDGGVWETFAGNNGAVLTNNGFALDLTDPNNNKTLGEIGGMLNFYQIGTNWSAFVKGDYRFADQYTSGSVKGGMRYQWP